MSKTAEGIFEKRFEKFRIGIFRSSLDHFLETGKLSGSALLEVREAMEEYAQQRVSELEKENERLLKAKEGLELSLHEYRSSFKALQQQIIIYNKWENEDSIPPINPVFELKGFIKREAELEQSNKELVEENKRLKEELRPIEALTQLRERSLKR